MGNFDLYGNSYATRQEALNAETAQCAEIDARLAYKKAKDLEDIQSRSDYYLSERLACLEERITALEKKLNPSP